MTITNHDYTNTEAEYQELRDFQLSLAKEHGLKLNWDAGRLEWWRHYIHALKDRAFFRTCAHVWRSDGEIAGYFISEYNRNDFFIILHPAHYGLLPEILVWIRENWTEGKSRIETYVFDDRRDFIADLLACGLVEDGHESNVRTYHLDETDLDYTLPEGYVIRTFADYGDFDGKIALIKNAFNKDEYPRARLEAFVQSPGYIEELDLIVIAPDGTAAAYCTGWEDSSLEAAGYIEPMGTHSDHRRLGLGKALARECFKRLHARGVRYADIASEAEPNISNYLYDSLGPKVKRRAFRFTLHL